ncbi:IS30 family transposase [Modestobacter marinus]|uniref:IS30 family transposase n=1 Tax=Modestobacter marinus TaxID=477641 RepID=A0A846LTX3_9ACTN|nr:IS30 family transposase [Modestobacter marinus]NIH66033.1 IS30 family transposase [Modestobacter marinus]NIH66080.1 IS30 family transposase [Modestobacter marinus]NIH69782.1 IS30 family transposase [Modestobacter marinus]
MPPLEITEPSGRFLSLSEREEIAVGLAAGQSARQIARQLGRAATTVSRELGLWAQAHPDRPYRAVQAQVDAETRGARPKPFKLAHEPLRERVQADLERKYSPRQIAMRLAIEFPDEPAMRPSHEAIYQALYVQGRGLLRRELAACLRTGRAIRRPRRRIDGRSDPNRRIPGKIMISERPAEAADRAVPGHWEGDLIAGKANKSYIGTLVERTTRFCILLHLPGTKPDPLALQEAIIAGIGQLPKHLRLSLTWDQGLEMRRHADITLAADLPIYFCDPHSPWQRGSNENTNGLLRQYFPKGTDLTAHTPTDLAMVAAELNGRPRQTLGWRTPAEALNDLLSPPQPTGDATTT